MITKNTLYTADNLFVLNGLNSESVDLIYLDPPFNSKRIYSAPIGSKAAGASFKDMWSWRDVNEGYLERLIDSYPYLVQYIQSIGVIHSKAMMAYVTFMSQRIIEMHRVLKPTGSFYLHCDPTASHYLKIVLDRVFGKGNFRNEIVWCYKTGGVSKRWFGRKHDDIYFYVKGHNYKFNQQKEKSYLTSGMASFTEGSPTAKKYGLNRDNGGAYRMTTMRDVWPIFPIYRNSKERTGYPTQKPLKLLERIIKASSNVGDIVLDPFCGCATTCVASQRLGRRWIGIDIEKNAANQVMERLSSDGGLFKDFIHLTKPPVRTDVETQEPDKKIKQNLYIKQESKCAGCFTEMELRHFHIDHIIPRAKGGGNYVENYQLLCGHCNSVKGDRPMEFLRFKISEREKLLRRQVSFGV